MKKLIFVGIMIAAMCAGCSSSSPVDKAITQIEKALEQVEKNKGNMTEEDWQNLAKEVEEPLQVIQDALEADQTSAMDKKIMALMAKWVVVVSEAGFAELGTDAQPGCCDKEKGAECPEAEAESASE